MADIHISFLKSREYLPDISEITIKQVTYLWNNLFPFDLVYRRKHSIKWMSVEHKSISFFQEAYDSLEERVVEKVSRLLTEMSKNSGMTDEELDKEFNELDLSKFNE